MKTEKVGIGCYLPKDIGQELHAYADQHAISRPNLCNLLIVRELRLERLGSLRHRFDGSVSKQGAARVTGRVNHAIKATFCAHVKCMGLQNDHAAAMIYRAELEERWLERAAGS